MSTHSAQKLPNLHERKRRMSKKPDDDDLIPQHFEYENQYEKWRAANPRIEYDFSVDESGYIYWIWTFFVVCGCLYNIIVLSVLAFENIRYAYIEKILPINIAFDTVFLFDIILRSMLSFYEDGVLITSFSETWRHYVHSFYFAIDLLAIFPFDYLLIRKTSAAFCRLNRFLKIYRIANFIAQSYGKLTQVTISLSKIFTACFLLFHVNACVFYIISVNSDTSSWDGVNATFDDDEYLPWPYTPEKITDAYFVGCDGRTDCYNPYFYYDEAREDHLVELYHFWRTDNRTHIYNFSQFTKEYTLSMYWSAMTMTTLGEQPAPNTSLQNAFEIVNTLAGLLLFAVIMGSIGDLVANANAVKTFWQTLMDGLKQYMTYRNLNERLQTKVLKYCEYEMAEETIMKEHEVRDELPAKLYGHVTTSIIGASLVRSPLFRASERSFLNDISQLLEPHYFCPGDVVIEKGQLCSSMFIIVCGQMVEITEDNEIDHFEGEILGDVNLIWFNNHLNHNRHQHNVISSAFSQIHMLSRDDFFKVLSSYDPKLKRRLCDVAFYLQRQRGELDDKKRCLSENEDIESNLKRLAIDTLELHDKMTEMEEEFWDFSATAKRKLFESEMVVCDLLNNSQRRSR
ncbi:Cyclic nucleotide-binding domain-containing protein [Caenorhabditis elegans]|uniref:Cyclic nucleotide-binding domain-containing protein n=1 Tax=Caenorhabditis elegans TaxID=6239 RepID=Q7Z205_CAEEL|nr:Cyclic nucleotide-binding domain-containing protein [Caenorhabditis elegans]CAD91630.2 Cyclic nucleotide-binding domain-containing protein [Caenorhabditis elegans]|eukprot:NP_001023194.1 Cyclic Nucleotide Gated channel [Caenorhabditis elegans]